MNRCLPCGLKSGFPSSCCCSSPFCLLEVIPLLPPQKTLPTISKLLKLKLCNLTRCPEDRGHRRGSRHYWLEVRFGILLGFRISFYLVMFSGFQWKKKTRSEKEPSAGSHPRGQTRRAGEASEVPRSPPLSLPHPPGAVSFLSTSPAHAAGSGERAQLNKYLPGLTSMSLPQS